LDHPLLCGAAFEQPSQPQPGLRAGSLHARLRLVPDRVRQDGPRALQSFLPAAKLWIDLGLFARRSAFPPLIASSFRTLLTRVDRLSPIQIPFQRLAASSRSRGFSSCPSSLSVLASGSSRAGRASVDGIPGRLVPDRVGFGDVDPVLFGALPQRFILSRP